MALKGGAHNSVCGERVRKGFSEGGDPSAASRRMSEKAKGIESIYQANIIACAKVQSVRKHGTFWFNLLLLWVRNLRPRKGEETVPKSPS